MSIFAYLLVAVALYAVWMPTINLALKRLTCSRSFSRTAVYEGEEGEMVEVIRNDSPFMIPWLRLESRGSVYLRFGSQENLDVSGGMFYCSLFAPMPYQQIRRTHKVKFLRRGVYHMGNASLTAGDFLDVLRLHRSQSLDASVMVYPRILGDDEIPPIMSQRLGELSNRRMLLQDPFLVRGIRPYIPGDPVRDIHWPATARTEQTQLRVRDYTTSTKLLVILNGQHQDMQWKQRRPEKLDEAYENAVALAASLCVRCLRNGIPAGFATNMAHEGGKDPILCLPMDGFQQEDSLLSHFARLDTSGICLQIVPFLKNLETYTGMDIMLLSFYDSESIQLTVERLRQCGNQVSFHLLEGGDL